MVVVPIGIVPMETTELGPAPTMPEPEAAWEAPEDAAPVAAAEVAAL